MAIPKHHIGFKGDECQCGRRASLRHCIQCGSSRIYSRMLQKHTFMDGHTELVENQFRCQTCGHLFIEAEREWCQAPPVGESLAKQRVRALYEAGKSGEVVTPQEQVAIKALDSLLPQFDPMLSKHDLVGQQVLSWRNEYAAAREVGQPFSDTLEEFVRKRAEQENDPDLSEYVAKWLKDRMEETQS